MAIMGQAIKQNKYIIQNGVATLFDKHGNHILVSEECLDKVLERCWLVGDNGYPKTTYNKKTIMLHDYLRQYYPDKISNPLALDIDNDTELQIDHKNQNRLDNTFSNLRYANYQANLINKHPTKPYGKYIYKERSGYRVRFFYNKTAKTIGTYKTLEKAIEVRDNFCEELKKTSALYKEFLIYK